MLPSSRMVTGIGGDCGEGNGKEVGSHQVEESGFHEVGGGAAALGGGDGKKVASPSSGQHS